MNKISLALVATCFSTPLLAHPGHDHSHWAPEPIHILTGLAIAAIVATSIYLVRNQKNKQQD